MPFGLQRWQVLHMAGEHCDYDLKIRYRVSPTAKADKARREKLFEEALTVRRIPRADWPLWKLMNRFVCSTG